MLAASDPCALINLHWLTVDGSKRDGASHELLMRKDLGSF
jgi:hypothetical protein